MLRRPVAWADSVEAPRKGAGFSNELAVTLHLIGVIFPADRPCEHLVPDLRAHFRPVPAGLRIEPEARSDPSVIDLLPLHGR